jgi:hypothetical protein
MNDSYYLYKLDNLVVVETTVKLSDFGLSFDMTGKPSVDCKNGDIRKTADVFCFVLTGMFYGCVVENITEDSMKHLVEDMYAGRLTIDQVFPRLREGSVINVFW